MIPSTEFVSQHIDRFVEELCEFLRIPSISTDPEYLHDVQSAAEWIAEHFESIGADDVAVHKTKGHPIVTAQFRARGANADAPTILVYGHYDVQPPDPLELWTSPPFEPEVREGRLYARGACDDKGQLFIHVKAAESYLAASDGLPVNLTFILEGEEESGSENLRPFLEAHTDLLEADFALISDTSMFDENTPTVTYGLRGLAYLQVEIQGPARDLHSGVYGGAVENPVSVMARLIAGLHDERGRVRVPGFYDRVLDLTEEERRAFAELPFDAESWLRSIGVSASRTEQGYTVLEATWARPAIDANGIWGGYQGKGAKTILPAKAGAKVSARLVPDQRPAEAAAQIRAYFEDNAPETVTVSVRELHGGRPFIIDRSSPPIKAAARALAAVFGREPAFVREGGTIPVVADVKEVLGIDTVLLGFGLNSDAIHSRDEHFGLDRFRKGVETAVRFYDEVRRVV